MNGGSKVFYGPSDITKFLDADNHKKYTRQELSDKFMLHPDTVDKWCDSLLGKGLIDAMKVGKLRFFMSVDYAEPKKFIGQVASERNFRPAREWKPGIAMQQVMERIDLNRGMKTMASNVLPPQNYFVIGGGFKVR